MIRYRFPVVRLASCILALGLFCAPTKALGQPTPTRLDVTVKDADESLTSDWFGIYFLDKKVGYLHSSRAKITEGGKTIYREKAVMHAKLQVQGKKTEMRIEQTTDFEARPPFRMIRADYHNTDENLKQRIQIAAKDKDYEATITTGAATSTKRIDNLDFCMADTLSAELWVKRKPKIGDKITTRDLEVEDLKVDLSTSTMKDAKESLVNGVKVVFYEVQTISFNLNITQDQKYDDNGRLLSGVMAGAFELRRESEKDAKNTEFSVDMFILGLAKIDRGLGDTSKLTGVILEIEAKDATFLPDGPRQSLVDKGKGVYQLRLGKKYGKQVKATEKDIKEALEDTVAYPIHDPKVKELAKKAVGDATTDEEKAKNILKFVKNYIKPSLAATLPKMLDLIDRKAGDCKSYALMYTCLARAAGLPSREVSGFMYMGDDVKAFGGHAWNEVLLDGYWVPVDAGFDQMDADPTHIFMGTDKESINNVLKSFGKLNFKLIEVERGK